MKSEYLAAVDIGTNSFHMAIVRPDESGNFEIITREKESVRLGSGGGDLDFIAPEAMERGLKVLGRFAALARSHNAPLKAVATSAVREASNQQDFLRRARAECGISFDIISGAEEARLIYRGVLGALPVHDRRILMVDIGGGSTEFLVGEGGRPLYVNSLKLGAIRLTERFFPKGEISGNAVNEARNFIRVAMTGVHHEIRKHGFELAVGCSGTIETLLSMARGGAEDLNDPIFHDTELFAVVQKILGFDSARKRVHLPGLDDRRADIIVGGAVLLREIFEALDIKTMRVSPYALREGIIFDELARAGLSAPAGQDVRRASTLALIDRLRPYPGRDQLSTCARISVDLFRQLKKAGYLPDLGENDELLLETGTMLHNIGMTISHSAHHKHGYYIIKNSDRLLGFTPREIEMIALLSRYHRKAGPGRKHEEFAALDESDQNRITRLVAILRIAISLNRSGKNLIESLKLTERDGALVFRLHPVTGADRSELDLDIWAATLKTELFEKVFLKKVRFEVA